MKNKDSVRVLCIFAVIFFFALSWYTMFDKSGKKMRQYNEYLETAREKRERSFYEDARDSYFSALEMRDSVELRNEILDFLKESNRGDAYAGYCEDLITRYPHEESGYYRLAAYYNDINVPDSCAEVIKRAERRNIQSSRLEELKESIKYKYDYIGYGYADVKPYVAGVCRAQNIEGDWGYLDLEGKTKLSFWYEDVTDYNGTYLIAKKKGEKYSILEITGRVKSDDPENKQIEDTSFFYEDKVALKYGGKYHYCDFNFKELFGSYDFAGAFNYGYAAVKNGNQWMFIDGKGNQVGDTYDDIKLDEKDIAFRNSRAFVKQGDKYYLIDTNFKRVSEDGWTNADNFNGNQPAAVFNGKKWGFVDEKGNIAIEFQYDHAKSFSNGFAAVEVNGRWGYITEKGDIVVELTYEDACDFNERGRAFVKNSSGWDMIYFYSFD